MANVISIHDTHRLDYKNAVITARRYGTTTQIPFQQADGTTLGTEIYTNSLGYLCNAGGTLYTGGVFVSEKAEITCTLRNGSSTNWIVLPDNTDAINDGKFYGEDPNNPGQLVEIFSANSATPGYLAWENILRKPSFNVWYESETVVKMMTANDTVNSSDTDLEFTKTMSIIKDDSLATPVSLKIIPDQNRSGQTIAVRNLTGFPLLLKNEDDSPICVIEPSDSETSRIKQLVLFGSGDHKLRVVGDAEFYQTVRTYSDVTWFSQGVTINDNTPDVVVISIPDTIRSTMMANNQWVSGLELPIICNNTSERKIKLWLQNNATFGGLVLSYGGNPLCVLNNSEIVEFVLPSKTFRDLGNVPSLTWKKDTGLAREIPKVYWDLLYAGTGNAKRLPIGLGTAEVDSNGYNVLDIVFDGKTQQTVFITVNNQEGAPITVNFKAPDGNVYAIYSQASLKTIYVFEQKGLSVYSAGRIGEGGGTPSEPISPTSSLEYSDVYDGSTLKLNINYLVFKNWTNFGVTNSSSDKELTLFVDVPDGESTDFTLDIEPYMTTYEKYAGIQVVIKLAAPGGTGSALLYGVATAGAGSPVECANYIQPQKILVHASRSGTTLSFTSEVLP